jgi:hypothetical protein
VPTPLAHAADHIAAKAQALELTCERQAALIMKLEAENNSLRIKRNAYM